MWNLGNINFLKNSLFIDKIRTSLPRITSVIGFFVLIQTGFFSGIERFWVFRGVSENLRLLIQYHVLINSILMMMMQQWSSQLYGFYFRLKYFKDRLTFHNSIMNYTVLNNIAIHLQHSSYFCKFVLVFWYYTWLSLSLCSTSNQFNPIEFIAWQLACCDVHFTLIWISNQQEETVEIESKKKLTNLLSRVLSASSTRSSLLLIFVSKLNSPNGKIWNY